MENIGFIEIKISGNKGNIELSPDNYDIKEIISILENAENLLYSGDKKNRPVISYQLEKGSVKNILKTSIQYIIGFNAIIGQINTENNINFLDGPTAKAIENIQNIARKNNFTFNIKTSLNLTNNLKIDVNTQYYLKEDVWIDAEFYFYGKITNGGGSSKTNIHILTDNYGKVIIQTPASFFENLTDNIIHKKSFGIRAKGKQNPFTGDIDLDNLKYIDIVEYQPSYDQKYLQDLRNKAKNSWLKNINPDNWLNEIRGGYA
ncbi:MAG: hypothetical protein ABI388_10815 [Bacteroidia bacterium]